mmetsp:Transcript_61155/g.162490  ORF Transcript_61155/g.162490 Transcript_61155/m.162490 type:complete len:608 (-) Transcript_61155:281-2104(-)
MVENLTEKERRSIRSSFDIKGAFSLVDRRSSGSITTNDMRSAMSLLGLDPSDVEMKMLFHDYSLSSDGTLKFETFLNMMKRRTAMAVSKRPRRGLREAGADQLEVHAIVCTGACRHRAFICHELAKFVRGKGVNCFLAPDVGTLLREAGCSHPPSGEQLVVCEVSRMQLQMQLEQSFAQVAFSLGSPGVIILDRALLDLSCNIPAEMWSDILSSVDLSEENMLARYDGVIHLVPDADASDEGRKRKESQTMDNLMQSCWARHWDVGFVPNMDGNTAAKVQRAQEFIYQLLVQRPMGAWQKRRPNPRISLPEACRLTRFVCTGGPCAGKSSLLAHLRKVVEEKGFDFYAVPEASSLLSQAGFDFPVCGGGERLVALKVAFLQILLQLESTIVQIASSTGRPSVILFDRGLMDISASLPHRTWSKVLETAGLNEKSQEKVISSRYDVVLHMATAADGAEAFYSSRGGDATCPTLEEARGLDRRVQLAWAKHPNVIRIENLGDGIHGKLQRATDVVLTRVVEHIADQPSSLDCEKELISSVILKQFEPHMTKGRTMSCHEITSLMQAVGADEWTDEHTVTLLRSAGLEKSGAIDLQHLMTYVFAKPTRTA